MQLKPILRLTTLVIIVAMLSACSPSKETLEKKLPRTYRFEAETLRHGEDILILNADHTYGGWRRESEGVPHPSVF